MNRAALTITAAAVLLMAAGTSARACYRMERDGRFWGFMRPVIDTLFWFQPNHCSKAYESELLRLQHSAAAATQP